MGEKGKRGRVRVALVEDHSLIATGFRRFASDSGDIELVAWVDTVDEVEISRLDVDVVVLDLRLGDGVPPSVNVSRLSRYGLPVLIYSQADDDAAVRAAVRAGAAGLVRKDEDPENLAEAIRAVARGDVVMGFDLAAALDSDEHLADARLTEREQQVLGLYATGATAQEVATALGISPHSVAAYLRRIRTKYTHVERPADTRVDLFVRAREDGLVAEVEV
ncbi:response regulator [Demequina sp. NBRC 110054]|uniref:response regulator transcription factor n=1 Tax=Demequina sp. NBRC 110054 TaxID=1570343 RepID=UPI000A0063E8|nr:response regulator [Demequina sp. NBRC 110054]